MKDTLLPFQTKRIEQLVPDKKRDASIKINSGRLLSPRIIEYLEISGKQATLLEEKVMR